MSLERGGGVEPWDGACQPTTIYYQLDIADPGFHAEIK
jgi:hypothetical protein